MQDATLGRIRLLRLFSPLPAGVQTTEKPFSSFVFVVVAVVGSRKLRWTRARRTSGTAPLWVLPNSDITFITSKTKPVSLNGFSFLTWANIPVRPAPPLRWWKLRNWTINSLCFLQNEIRGTLRGCCWFQFKHLFFYFFPTTFSLPLWSTLLKFAQTPSTIYLIWFQE